MITEKSIGEWKTDNYQITILQKEDRLFARVQNLAGNSFSIDAYAVKCGIRGTHSHSALIQKINQLTQEKIQEGIFVSAYPIGGQPKEVWVYEATKLSATWINKAKIELKQVHPGNDTQAIECYQKALKNLETALKMQQQMHGDVNELNVIISDLKKDLFLLEIKCDLPLYLSSEEITEFNDIIEAYKKEQDFFTCLSTYIKAFEDSERAHIHYLKAAVDEYNGDFISAIPHYFSLAENHFCSQSCFKKIEKLIKKAKDPFALPHFLEKLDRNLLVELNQKTTDSDLERWIQQKDAVRTIFEKCLVELGSSSKKTPTCFICFNVEETDVGKWLEHTLVPDLVKMGIEPIFCFKDLSPGKELNAFQGLIRSADQVIVVCTPDLKRKCEERKKAPTGVAQEIRLAIERYNDPDKSDSIFTLFLKGDRKSACPSEFFEPIFGTKFTILDKSKDLSVFSYYANTFELFGAMKQIQREVSREIKEDFLAQVNKILIKK